MEKGNVRIQWVGTNFPELYEWLINGSATRDFILRIKEPGNPQSSIEIKIKNSSLHLKKGDWVFKDVNGSYYVVDNECI